MKKNTFTQIFKSKTTQQLPTQSTKYFTTGAQTIKDLKPLINKFSYLFSITTPLTNKLRSKRPIVLSVLIVFIVSACQTTNRKTEKQIAASPHATEIEKLNTSMSATELMASLEQCYFSNNCKVELDNQLNNWLVEKNFIPIDKQAETDEQDNQQLSKIVTSKNPKSLAKVHLSSNYMNNQLVQGAMNEWLTWKRPQLLNTWQYYQYLKKDMLKSFEKYKIDEAFILAIMAQESGGKVHSRSRAGAGGLFQIMPATGRRLGLSGKDGAYDMRFNPTASAAAAAKYIEEQWKLYDGDKAKILAAYNSGETRFARLNRKYKNKPIWNKSFYYELPRETRQYIPIVIAAMLIFQDPEKFNVTLTEVAPETIVVQLPKKSSLSELSICLGQEHNDLGWFRVLRNLNSGMKADKVIKAKTDLVIPKILETAFKNKCQVNNDLMKLAQSLHEADFQDQKGVFRYKVKQGDSLNKIAGKFRCTTQKEIASLNRIKAPRYLIRAGKYLKIPQC